MWTQSAADKLPPLLHSIVTSPRIAVGSLLLICSLLDLILLPCYLVSLLVTETGLYIGFVTFLWCIGRVVLRFLTFPGSTYRVYHDIESEFTKYSIRLLEHSVDSCRTLALTLQRVGQSSSASITRKELHELLSWREKTILYRNRVFEVYVSVLGLFFEPEETYTLPSHGNNSLHHNRSCIDHRISPTALLHGKQLYSLLKTLLGHIEDIEEFISKTGIPPRTNQRIITQASLLYSTANELKQWLSNLTYHSSTMMEDGTNHQRQWKHLVTQILHHIDPPLYSSIFNLHVLRGCFLARYQNSKQIWIHRPDGGRIDAIYIPSLHNERGENGIHDKAMVYCNPNAGHMELATGMALFGGNVCKEQQQQQQQQQEKETSSREQHNWVDFYLDLGYDVYLFNYSGYGRSFGGRYNMNSSPPPSSRVSKLLRISYLTMFGFRPSPQSLKDDALTVCKHALNHGVKKLIIHGESIGGMAAASAANILQTERMDDFLEILLICDRTFYNLISAARKMVGEWTKSVIPYLVPYWKTDVARDYATATCKKIVAQDTNDTIIHDSASLKSGLALAIALYSSDTKKVGLSSLGPLNYDVLAFENKRLTHKALSPPTWPADKTISSLQALHFSACVRRIHVLASFPVKHVQEAVTEEGIEIPDINSPNKDLTFVEEGTPSPMVEQVWKILGSCDGFDGPLLGEVVEHGLESIIIWVCTLLVFGVENKTRKEALLSTDEYDMINSTETPTKGSKEKSHLSIREVIDSLQFFQKDNRSFDFTHELDFCIDTLKYIAARVTPTLADENNRMTGQYLQLGCGHNNFYSVSEQTLLREKIHKAFIST